jgi:hypothetical protein
MAGPTIHTQDFAMTRLAFTLLLLALPISVWSQDPKTTYADPNQTDADFAYQGEYAAPGWGLQVVAGGGGKFDALLHPGGLPGAGWNKAERIKLSGALEGSAVVLKGDKYSATVRTNQAELSDASGRVVARLTKRVRISPTLGQRPPAGAKVLFNGSSTEQFVGAKMTDDHLLRMGPHTKDAVGDFRLHLEFRVPYMPYARGQGRANSGVYIQQRYEVQILDSFGLSGAKNECGAMYEQRPPEVNMALPPLAWQTYDIWFRQPRWSADGKEKLKPATITVLHNGVQIHRDYALTNKTGGGKPEGPEEFPIALQDHGNPVVFRNIWLVPGQGVYPPPAPAATPTSYCVSRRGPLRRLLSRR